MSSQAALADLIASLGAPTAATPARAARPCDDPFCAGTTAACGWQPAEHTGRRDGGRAILAAANPLKGTAYEGVPRAVDTIVNPDPPPSTVALMRDVLADLDASRPRSRQAALGPSELGTPCQRQLAMKLARLPRQLPDSRPPWAPMQGTAMHVLMEEALRLHNTQLGRERWVIEQRLHMDGEISGSGDAYDADHATVIDWKYTGVTAIRDLRRRLPNDQLVKPDYRVQAHLYGYGHERAGRPVHWVRLVFLARSHDYDASGEWTEAYDPQVAIRALDRYYATQDLITNLHLAATPALWAAVPAAPGSACDWCPFRRPGGPADGTGCPGNLQARQDKQLTGLIA